MAILDDLQAMAAEDAVYLSQTINDSGLGGSGGTDQGSTAVYRGRLRQAADGSWVFSTFSGQIGLVGIALGQANQGGTWTSTASPSGNATVTIARNIVSFMDPTTGIGAQVQERVVLSEVIPPAFVQ